MIIGERLRTIREEKNFSQGEIQARTGMLRCYVSRVENGHTIPSVETLEKFARALETPLYRLFYEGIDSPPPPAIRRNKSDEVLWGDQGKDTRVLHRFRTLLGQMKEADRQLFLHMVKKVGTRKTIRKGIK
jgi:transcriptional regulator with XRE-family HTH domain